MAEDIATYAALILSIGTLIKVFWKPKSERLQSDGDAAESYANAAKTFADEVVKLKREISEVRANLQDQNQCIDDLKQINDDLRDWAERLVHQVQSLGADPVKPRKKGFPNGGHQKSG